MLKLHCAPQTISVATAITLNEAGLELPMTLSWSTFSSSRNKPALDYLCAQSQGPGAHAGNARRCSDRNRRVAGMDCVAGAGEIA